MSGNNNVGGIIVSHSNSGNTNNKDTITNCTNSDLVTGTGVSVGRIAGILNGGTLLNCVNAGVIIGNIIAINNSRVVAAALSASIMSAQ